MVAMISTEILYVFCHHDMFQQESGHGVIWAHNPVATMGFTLILYTDDGDD